MLFELSEVSAESPQPPRREPPGGVPELSRASEARSPPSHARPRPQRTRCLPELPPRPSQPHPGPVSGV